MTIETIKTNMDLAFKQDRERFFKVADTLHLQPAYADHLDELEEIKQAWRDVPDSANYPVITHPMPLPDWFPKINFASSFDGQNYIDECLEVTEAEDEDILALFN